MPSNRPRRDGGSSTAGSTPESAGTPINDRELPAHSGQDAERAARDLADVPAVEVITATAVHLMSAAAVKVGLAEDVEPDLDEARKLITVLAALVTAAAPEIGSQHARPLRDGVRSLQLAFREASAVPDPPGQGPGERQTGPVS
jgi:hypothetical protein